MGCLTNGGHDLPKLGALVNIKNIREALKNLISLSLFRVLAKGFVIYLLCLGIIYQTCVRAPRGRFYVISIIQAGLSRSLCLSGVGLAGCVSIALRIGGFLPPRRLLIEVNCTNVLYTQIPPHNGRDPSQTSPLVVDWSGW